MRAKVRREAKELTRMSKIFISHSSKDKSFARQLATDLEKSGHAPWLDEWEICVGECISSKISAAIEAADFVIIVLSLSAVESGWVEKEWRSKYWTEIQDGTVQVVPVLIESCKIPLLLRSKRYADFREDYAGALEDLTSSIERLARTSEPTDWRDNGNDSDGRRKRRNPSPSLPPSDLGGGGYHTIKPQPTLSGYVGWSLAQLASHRGLPLATCAAWVIDRWVEDNQKYLERLGISPANYREHGH
jgi:hypothetical protein